MSKRHLLVSALVVALCSGILVLFTDLEHSLAGWFGCGKLGSGSHSRHCR